MQTPFDQRENNFDIIRMSLAVLVIFSHSYPLGTGSEALEPFKILTRGQATGGHIAVDLFFIISGFLITASFERSRTISSYLKKRFFRIYPGFVVAMLWCALFVLPRSGGHFVSATPVGRSLDFVTQTAQLRAFHERGSFPGVPFQGALNGSTWSIPYEFWCYIGVILLGISGMLRSRRWLLGLFVVSTAVALVFSVKHLTISGNILGQVFGYPPYWARLLPIYLAGVIAYRFRAHLSLQWSWIVTACVLLVAAARLPQGWVLLWPVVGTYLVLVVAFHPAIRFHNWNRFGDFSYGTYLYAYPVQQLVMRWFGHPVAPFKLFVIAAPLTFGCAVCSWFGVERWFLQRAHRAPVSLPAVSNPAVP